MAGEKDQMQGRFKEAAGDLTGDKNLKNEGKVDRSSGTVKKTTDRLADKIKNVLRKR